MTFFCTDPIQNATQCSKFTFFQGHTSFVAHESLFPSQYHLLTLAAPLVELLLAVLPLVLFTPLDGLQLLALDFPGLLDHLGYVSVTLDALDLGPVVRLAAVILVCSTI